MELGEDTDIHVIINFITLQHLDADNAYHNSDDSLLILRTISICYSS